MSFSELPTIARFREDSLEVFVYENRALAGRAAAQGIVQAIGSRQRAHGIANIVFAAAPSQDEFLAGLVADAEIDWSRVTAFHMDEYLGIDADHPASFRRYLQEHLFRLVGIGQDRLRLIPGEQVERPLQTCLAYEDLLRANPTDIVCAGIGENGHLAFNDPPVADFLDPVLVKVVRLDAPCRNQQLNDGCFDRLEEIPTHAYTLTIPALLRRTGGFGCGAGPTESQCGLDHPAWPDQRGVPSHGACAVMRGLGFTSIASRRGWCSDVRSRGVRSTLLQSCCGDPPRSIHFGLVLRHFDSLHLEFRAERDHFHVASTAGGADRRYRLVSHSVLHIFCGSGSSPRNGEGSSAYRGKK